MSRKLQFNLDRSIRLFVASTAWAVGCYLMWSVFPPNDLLVAVGIVTPVLSAAIVGCLLRRPIGCVVAVLVLYVLMACVSAVGGDPLLPPFWRVLLF